MQRTLATLVVASVMALGLAVGAGAGNGTALAAGGGASSLAQFCQANPGLNPYPGSSQGACVSFLTSGETSVAYAPGLCNWLATGPYLGQGYGFILVFASPTNGLAFSSPVYNQGQCVSTIAQESHMGYYNIDAFYPS